MFPFPCTRGIVWAPLVGEHVNSKTDMKKKKTGARALAVFSQHERGEEIMLVNGVFTISRRVAAGVVGSNESGAKAHAHAQWTRSAMH